jgi:inorganic pyrophosphatase
MVSKSVRVATPRTASLLTLPPFDNEYIRVVIETPKGSHNKYDFEPKLGIFEHAAVLPEGMTFPYDFGFIPATLGDDGDPLDVLVFMDFPVMPGCLVRARLLGGIQAEQTERDGKRVRNDRLIAVAAKARLYQAIETLSDLRAHCLDEIKEFFIAYNKQNGKRFHPIGDCDAAGGLKLVRKGMRRFTAQRS